MREERSGMSEDGDGAGEEEDGSALCLGGGGVGSAKSRGGAGGCTEADRPPPFSDQVLENVLENVLQFLVSHRDRNAVSLVCRSWYRAEAHTRRELFIGNCYAVSPRRAIDRFSHVRSLVLKGKPRFADFNLVPIGWGAHFSPWVSAMAPAYPWLERVCLKRVSVADDDLSLLAFSFPFFKDLTLICCDGFSTAGLAVVTERCRPSLHHSDAQHKFRLWSPREGSSCFDRTVSIIRIVQLWTAGQWLLCSGWVEWYGHMN